MKTILVPTDFSIEATNALDFALKLTQKYPFKILVLHVVQYPVREYSNDKGEIVPLDDEFARLLDKNIENKMALFLNKNIDKVKYKIEVGHPTKVISRYANAKSLVDLVIMGSQGTSGMKDFIIGSNTEKVVRLAECPVIAIKDKSEPSDIKKIVFGTNFKDTSEDLVKRLKELQDLFKATVNLVRVNTPNNFRRDADVQKDIDAFIEQYGIRNYQIDIYNDVNEEEGLMTYALDAKADLIAIGTHGYRGLKHFFSGSIAERVVNHSKVPIWTYHFVPTGK